jgi:ferritin-like metal-binding protein YciE
MSSGNLSPAERWISTLAGFSLILGAAVRGSLLRRLTFVAGGATLLSRGLVGYCGMKASLVGDADSLGEGMHEQWQLMRSQAGAGPAAIDTLEALQLAEMQELASSTAQLARLLDRIERGIGHNDLQMRVRSYATQLNAREQDLERIISSRGASPRRHPDQAMRTLVEETRKMAHVADPAVRDAALVDSLQRIIHYQIAAEGSAAAHAKTLGRDEDAARIGDWVDRDKAVDASLTELAKALLNPRAAGRSGTGLGATGAAAGTSTTGTTAVGTAGIAGTAGTTRATRATSSRPRPL